MSVRRPRLDRCSCARSSRPYRRSRRMRGSSGPSRRDPSSADRASRRDRPTRRDRWGRATGRAQSPATHAATRPGRQLGRLEHVVLRVVPAGCQPVREQDGEQRNEERAKQEQKGLERDEADRERPSRPNPAKTTTSSSRCDTPGTRFWSDTAPEYALANASSVSVTVSANSGDDRSDPTGCHLRGQSGGVAQSVGEEEECPSDRSSQSSGRK